jgi:hypothetical protein
MVCFIDQPAYRIPGDLAAVGAAANALKNVALGDSVCQRAVLEAGGEAAVAKAIATLPLDTDIVKTLREALAAARRASSDGDDRSGTEGGHLDELADTCAFGSAMAVSFPGI